MSLKIETEIKIDSDPCVLAWESQLFVGTEDGSIKVSLKSMYISIKISYFFSVLTFSPKIYTFLTS